MNPEQYERHVAAELTREGWKTAVSRLSGDLGVDVLAERRGRRLAVQAKMYGASTTKVNHEQVMCLHGAAAYADCPEMMLATDGQLTAQAQKVAAKLGIEVRHIPSKHSSTTLGGAPASFGDVWERHIEPMAQTQITRVSGSGMQILTVDGAGVRRLTSKGEPQLIPIELLRWAIKRLLAGHIVTRQDVRDRHAGRFASGVMDILAAVPQFEHVQVGRSRAVRRRVAPAL